MKKRILVLALLLLILGTFAGCEALDVIGNGSVEAFGELLAALPASAAPESSLPGYSLSAPDGSAAFLFSSDFSLSDPYDLALVLEAQPFLDAGLDMAKLPAAMAQGDKIVIGAALESAEFPGAADTPLAAFARLRREGRERLQYHGDMDHYGVSLGDGHVLEWAKDPAANDKDLVFVLNPQPFRDAGADLSRVEGWILGEVNVMEGMRTVAVEKLLKPFSLER